MSETVGRIEALHRYPVKSMRGEEPETVEVTPTGVLGDRAYALIDRASGHVVSAKRPKRWAGILDYAATFTAAPVADRPVPPVRIVLPGGVTCDSSDRETLDQRVSKAFGCEVGLESSVPEGASFEYHWPDMDGLEWDGREVRDEITVHDMPPGTFFDSSTVVLQTTTALTEFERLVPGSDFDVSRFRPNIIIEPTDGASGFVENAWVGRTLCLGDTVRLAILKPCMRCVMVNLEQGDVPADPAILKATFQHNDGNLGVKSAVAVGGHISIGDEVRIE